MSVGTGFVFGVTVVAKSIVNESKRGTHTHTHTHTEREREIPFNCSRKESRPVERE